VRVREQGTVKWFSAVKRYGFIVCDSGKDIFVHYTEISGPGPKFLREGQRVSFLIGYEPKGPRAIEVASIDEGKNLGARARVSS
jgi:CspA family cold shock protein